MPSRCRNATNAENTSSGSSLSATVVTGARASVDQAPAWSQFPWCASAITTPRPAASSARTGSSPSARTVASRRSRVHVGSRNASHQYRR
jgi:hypothetical protein